MSFLLWLLFTDGGKTPLGERNFLLRVSFFVSVAGDIARFTSHMIDLFTSLTR